MIDLVDFVLHSLYRNKQPKSQEEVQQYLTQSISKSRILSEGDFNKAVTGLIGGDEQRLVNTKTLLESYGYILILNSFVVVDLQWLSMIISMFVSSNFIGGFQNDTEKKFELKDPSNISECEGEHCDQKFSLFWFKYHCNECGGIYCSECSKGRLRLPHRGHRDPVRVCERCEENLLQRGIDGIDENIPHLLSYDKVVSGIHSAFYYFFC